MTKWLKRLSETLKLAIVSLLITSCGVDTMGNYLEYPPALFVTSSTAMIFYAPSIFEPNFFGVNIYYRIYESEATADADESAFQARQLAEVVPGTSVSSYLLPISGLKYKQVCSLISGQAEQLSVLRSDISPGSMLTIELIGSKVMLKLGLSSAIELYRNLPGGVNNFSTVPVAANQDYAPNVDDTDGKRFLQFYAVAYGFSDALLPIYSKAAFLGSLTLQ
jgi:hypothetical protein